MITTKVMVAAVVVVVAMETWEDTTWIPEATGIWAADTETWAVGTAVEIVTAKMTTAVAAAVAVV